MFATIIYAAGNSEFRMRLPEVERQNYDSVLKLFVTPFLALGRMMGADMARRLRRTDIQAQDPTRT